jgi:hypothetical protein
LPPKRCSWGWRMPKCCARQVVVDGGLQDQVVGVEVAMRQVIAHACDLAPRDAGLGAEHLGGQGLHGFVVLVTGQQDHLERVQPRRDHPEAAPTTDYLMQAPRLVRAGHSKLVRPGAHLLRSARSARAASAPQTTSPDCSDSLASARPRSADGSARISAVSRIDGSSTESLSVTPGV